MERRVTSHTEEEEMNQRRYLLDLARKGDETAIGRLLELYQVKVYSGDKLRTLKVGKNSALAPGPKKKTKAIATVPAKKKPAKRETSWRAPHTSRKTHTAKTHTAKTHTVKRGKTTAKKTKTR